MTGFQKNIFQLRLTDVLKENAPEIEEMTRVAERDFSFINGDKTFSEKGLYADKNFFDVFTFPLVQAGSLNVLSDMNSIVISDHMARKFFESTDCVGKTLIMKDGSRQDPFKIAGVFKEVPRQSKLQFDFVIPFSRFLAENSWAPETGATANETWVLLKNNVNRRFVENKIKNLIKNQETTIKPGTFLISSKRTNFIWLCRRKEDLERNAKCCNYRFNRFCNSVNCMFQFHKPGHCLKFQEVS